MASAKKHRFISQEKFKRVVKTLEAIRPGVTGQSLEAEIPAWFRAVHNVSPECGALTILAPNLRPITAFDTADGKTKYMLIEGKAKYEEFLGAYFDIHVPNWINDLDSKQKPFDWFDVLDDMETFGLSDWKKTSEYQWARNFFNGHLPPEEV